MKRIVVKATARADVAETWTIDLPDEHPVIEDIYDVDLNELMRVGTVVSCKDEVSNEEDRDVQSFTYEVVCPDGTPGDVLMEERYCTLKRPHVAHIWHARSVKASYRCPGHHGQRPIQPRRKVES